MNKRGRRSYQNCQLRKQEAYFCSNPGRGGAEAGGGHRLLSAWPLHFVLEASEDSSFRVRVRGCPVSTNRVARDDWLDPAIKWARPNLRTITIVNRRPMFQIEQYEIVSDAARLTGATFRRIFDSQSNQTIVCLHGKTKPMVKFVEYIAYSTS
jgi:hypothetical protein